MTKKQSNIRIGNTTFELEEVEDFIFTAKYRQSRGDFSKGPFTYTEYRDGDLNMVISRKVSWKSGAPRLWNEDTRLDVMHEYMRDPKSVKRALDVIREVRSKISEGQLFSREIQYEDKLGIVMESHMEGNIFRAHGQHLLYEREAPRPILEVTTNSSYVGPR